LTHPRQTHRTLTLIAIMLATFMAAMEMTVVSTAMPAVVGELGGIHLYAWVFTGYMLSATVMVPIFGKLADLYGRKPMILFGIAVFLLGSIGSGLSTTMLQLVIFRVVQGFGAGAMQPISITIIGDMYSLEERAKVQGMVGAIWGLAGLVGPLLGGAIVEWLTWHWIFFINVPFGVLAAVVLVAAFHERIEKRAHALDYAGAALLSGAILCLLAAASGGVGVWPVGVASLLLVGFVAVERRAPEPVLPLALLRDRVIGLSNLAGALVGAAMMSTVTYVPLFVQGIAGGSATDAGRAITPMVIAWPIFSTLGGELIPRVGFRPVIRAGLALTAGSALLLALLLEPGLPIWAIGSIMAGYGAGLGLANTALLLAVQTAVDWRQRGVATASTMFFRTIGGALTVGALGGLIAAGIANVPGVPPGAADELLGPDHGRSLPVALLRSLSSALADGLHTSFLVIAALAILALAVGLAFPRPTPSPERVPAA